MFKRLGAVLRRSFRKLRYLGVYVCMYGIGALRQRWRDSSYLPSRLTWFMRFFYGISPLDKCTWTRLDRKVRAMISGASTIEIVVSFQWGGGAAEYVRNYLSKVSSEVLVIVVKQTIARGILDVEFWRAGKRCVDAKANGLCFLSELPREKVTKLIVNELVLWHRYLGLRAMTAEGMERLTAELLLIRETLHCNMLYLVHDYFAICPRITLLTSDNVYCQTEFDEAVCMECMRSGVSSGAQVASNCDVHRWRATMQRFFERIDEVRTFSYDTKRRMERVFPTARFTYVPHQPLDMLSAVNKLSFNPVVIGVIGNISVLKGAYKILELAEYLATRHAQVRIVVLGRFEVPAVGYGNLVVHGSYKRRDLPDLVRHYGISVVLFPSIWPETFSYVAQEVMQLNIPLVCYNLGAVPERIADYPHGGVAMSFAPEATWKAIEMVVERERRHCNDREGTTS